MTGRTSGWISTYPVIRSFYRQNPPQSTRYVTEFYEMLGAATQARRTAKAMARSGNEEEVNRLLQVPEQRQYGTLHRVNLRLQKLRRYRDAILRSRDLQWLSSQARQFGIDPTGKDLGTLKKELRDRMIQTRNELTKKAVTEVKRETANVE